MAVDNNNVTFDLAAQQVAGVYAKAFLGAAETAGKLPSLVAEYDSFISEVIERSPEFDRLLGSSFISHEEKQGILDRVLGTRASSNLIVFLKVVSGHGRLDCLRAIHREVLRRYHIMQGRVDVTLRTAVPLDDGLRREIVNQLTKVLNAEPELTIIAQPELLGGLVVTVGDTVYDASVATRLALMRSRMLERSVDEIDANRDRFWDEGDPGSDAIS